MTRSEGVRKAAVQAMNYPAASSGELTPKGLEGDSTSEIRPSSTLIYSLSLLAKSGGVIAVVTKTIRMIAA
jgi:hypothetical protein